MALKLIACLLLLEITTFLRECYRTLPRPTRAQARSSHFWADSRAPSRDHVSSSGRRWSMAAQSIAGGQSLLSQQSSLAAVAAEAARSGANGGAAMVPAAGNVLNTQASSEIVVTPTGGGPPTLIGPGGPLMDHPRKISFVLQDDIQAFNANQSMLAVQVGFFKRHCIFCMRRVKTFASTK